MRFPQSCFAVLAAVSAFAASACTKPKEQVVQPDEETATPSAAEVSGVAVYREFCATCHMDDGSGVPNIQPGLIGSPIIAGDPSQLKIVIRAGSAALRERKSQYGNEMPPFGMLTEEQVDAVAGYLREQFGPGSQ